MLIRGSTWKLLCIFYCFFLLYSTPAFLNDAQISNLCINILHLVRTLTFTIFKHSFCLENIWLHYYSSCLLSLYISPEYYYTKADEVKRSDTELAVNSLLATYFIAPLIQKLSALWCSCQVGLKPMLKYLMCLWR